MLFLPPAAPGAAPLLDVACGVPAYGQAPTMGALRAERSRAAMVEAAGALVELIWEDFIEGACGGLPATLVMERYNRVIRPLASHLAPGDRGARAHARHERVLGAALGCRSALWFRAGGAKTRTGAAVAARLPPHAQEAPKCDHERGVS